MHTDFQPVAPAAGTTDLSVNYTQAYRLRNVFPNDGKGGNSAPKHMYKAAGERHDKAASRPQSR